MSGFYSITTAAMERLKNCSAPTARRELRRVRAELGLEDKQPLMLFQLAALWGCEVADLTEALKKSNRKLAA